MHLCTFHQYRRKLLYETGPPPELPCGPAGSQETIPSTTPSKEGIFEKDPHVLTMIHVEVDKGSGQSWCQDYDYSLEFTHIFLPDFCFTSFGVTA